MSVVFLEQMGGRRPVCCSTCGTNLSDESQMQTYKYGPNRVFYKAVNVTMSEPMEKELYIGKRIFRYVYCKKCDTKLGYISDFAMDRGKYFKVGKFFFEKERIIGLNVE